MAIAFDNIFQPKSPLPSVPMPSTVARRRCAGMARIRCPAATGGPPAWFIRSSTADVQKIVRSANAHGVPLYPISTGNNIGLGSRSASGAGQVVIDLGHKMNRILDIDERLGFAVVEPGVSYQAMYDELVRRGNKLMLDVTSGPPQGGMLGNALDKGAGYTPYFDHFGFSCGMEVVLGNGEVMRTGDGSLNHDKLVNWPHISKYSFGPILDGLFAQSNYGIVTRMGVWLLPRPPAVRTFHFMFPDDGDLEEIIELARPMKMSNFVPSLFRVCNDLYLCGSEGESPEYRMSEWQEVDLRCGTARVATEARPRRLDAVGRVLRTEHRRHRAADRARAGSFHEVGQGALHRARGCGEIPPLQVAINAFSGIPSLGELGLLKWRPGGGNTWFLPGTPMDGKIANEFQKLCRNIYEDHGLDYTVMNVCSARFARGLHVITFNREDPDERARADACYRKMSEEVAKRGVFVGRAPLDYHDMHFAQTMPGFQQACAAIKKALDPKGVIAPGRYGIN